LELVELGVEQILLLPLSLVVAVAEEDTTAEVEEELIPIAPALTVVVAVVDRASSMQLNSQHLSTLQAFNQPMELRVFPTTLAHRSLTSLLPHLRAKQHFQYLTLLLGKVSLD
jgi:hypothetical protein